MHSNCHRWNPLQKSVISNTCPWLISVCGCVCVCVSWAFERRTLSDAVQRDRMRTSQVSEFVQPDRGIHSHTHSHTCNHVSDIHIFSLARSLSLSCTHTHTHSQWCSSVEASWVLCSSTITHEQPRVLLCSAALTIQYLTWCLMLYRVSVCLRHRTNHWSLYLVSRAHGSHYQSETGWNVKREREEAEQ